MDAYEAHLLRLVVEAVVDQYPETVGGFHLHPPYAGTDARANEWMVSRGATDAWGTTLADALIVLLADLGVEVPERPSVLDGHIAWDGLETVIAENDGTEYAVEYLRGLYAREPLTVLALLEGA
jgi:hypothetical protein